MDKIVNRKYGSLHYDVDGNLRKGFYSENVALKAKKIENRKPGNLYYCCYPCPSCERFHVAKFVEVTSDIIRHNVKCSTEENYYPIHRRLLPVVILDEQNRRNYGMTKDIPVKHLLNKFFKYSG